MFMIEMRPYIFVHQIPVVRILADELPETLPLKTLAWALSFGACLGGNGTLLGTLYSIILYSFTMIFMCNFEALIKYALLT